MATKAQYEAFKFIYEEENTRLNELVTRAKVYLSLTTFVLGAFFLKIDTVLEITRGVPILGLTAFISETVFFAALVITVLSLRIMGYEGVCSPEKEIRRYGEQLPDDGEFLEDRIVDMAFATERNRKQNNRRGKCLKLAGVCLMIGFGSLLAFLIMTIAN